VYVKKATEGIMFVTLYIDDMLLAGNNMEMVQTTKKCYLLSSDEGYE